MQFSKIIDPNWPAPKKIKVYSITRNFFNNINESVKINKTHKPITGCIQIKKVEKKPKSLKFSLINNEKISDVIAKLNIP